MVIDAEWEGCCGSWDFGASPPDIVGGGEIGRYHLIYGDNGDCVRSSPHRAALFAHRPGA